MRSIHKFAYAAVLSLSIFAVQPSPAAAEDIRGSFTLSHEVRCHKILLRPGDYAFSIRTVGPTQLLVIRGLNGTGTNAMLMANEVEASKPKEVSRLVLVSRDGQSFVSSMQLPDYDMTLRFAVPPENTAKQ
jgi:hypothetical protein